MLYKLGTQEFKTWKNVHEYASHVLSKGKRMLSEDELLFALDLLKYHPYAEEKQKNGIATIFVGEPEYGTHFCFIIRRPNGEIEDFSYKKCKARTNKDLEKARDRIEVSDRLEAYRYSVLTQTKKFYRNSHSKCCVCCGNSSNLQVDHKEPSFIQLVNDFENSLKQKKFPATLRHHEHKAYIHKFDISTGEDKGYVELWQKYHEKHATFQILCGECNLRKGASARYKIKFS